MKQDRIRHHYQSARIYRHQYRPSFNLLRLFGSLLSVWRYGSAAGPGTLR